MTIPNAMDVLANAGSAPKALSWGGVGERSGGRIVSDLRTYQPREYSPSGLGPLKFYEDGSPVWAVSVDVQTNEREDSNDNGIRRMYIEKPRMLAAVRAAYQAVGADGIQKGGTLYVWQTGVEPATRGAGMANTYAASYSPPGVAVPQTTPAPVEYRAPVQQTAMPSAPARPQLKASIAAAMQNVGADLSQFEIVPD